MRLRAARATRSWPRSAVLALPALLFLAASGGAVDVRPGAVVRWAGEAQACAVGDRVWAPIDEVCYYPVDLQASGELTLQRRVDERWQERTVRVGDYPYPEQHLTVEPKHVELSAADLERVQAEQERISALWNREREPEFRLPLAPPLAKLPAGGRFGARRVFNGSPRSPHSGADFSVPRGTPVLAAADGVVALAEEHFFGGRSVYVDHGGGLVTMYFHLDRIETAAGERVARGQRLGVVGSTGRSTGPHLHFGMRWHGARVDPALLLDPGGMPRIEEGSNLPHAADR